MKSIQKEPAGEKTFYADFNSIFCAKFRVNLFYEKVLPFNKFLSKKQQSEKMP